MFRSMRKREGNSFIQLLLDVGLDINALNKCGTTMLSQAAESGNLQIAEFLLQKGADANIANSDGSTPFHIAAKYGRKDIVKLFLDRGLFVDIRDKNEHTPLHYITVENCTALSRRQCYQELVHILVDRNADLNAVNRNGCTPLLLAAKRSCKYIFELFIKLGADVDCCDEDQYTVLHHVCQNGWSGTVRTLVEGRFGLDLNAKTSKGHTPVYIAAYFSHVDVVKLLDEYGADIDSESLMKVSCLKERLEVVKYLVSKGCDVNARDLHGVTPVIWAGSWFNFDVVEYLMDCGADVEGCDVDGQTLLHFASYSQGLEMVKSLVKKGCDVNAKDDCGDTPLHLAIQEYDLEIIKHLLNAGADSYIVNNVGETQFSMFINKSLSLEVIILFINNGAYFRTDDYDIISNNSLLKVGILQDTQLCTEALINKFNNADLLKIYSIPGISKRLPRFEKLKIPSRSNVARNISESVQYEIQTKGHCNLLNVRPIVLSSLCVLTLAKHYNS